MVKADTGQENYFLTDEHKQLLDERLAAHKASPQEGSTWNEVKNRVTQKT
ncbi:addiction module protein [Chryseosolibacter indicus]|uniref:Addiction module protein n=1 Tax=Chryseosolibacter indicus TaxID=2782351 RepID=A0ABS5VVI6_9BACT|nr:addiction module protein [Chryseosolibacter indicus]MBT1704827.1 addiction module protein [Chryseosolibacter indicus]